MRKCVDKQTAKRQQQTTNNTNKRRLPHSFNTLLCGYINFWSLALNDPQKDKL